MTAHTPEPWTAEPPQNDTFQKSKVYGPKHADGSNYAPLCEVNNYPDARLIAAAPAYHKHAYTLAILVLQSGDYEHPDIRDAVDNILAIHQTVEGKPCLSAPAGDCSCSIDTDVKGASTITYCAMHSAAADMRAMLKKARSSIQLEYGRHSTPEIDVLIDKAGG